MGPARPDRARPVQSPTCLSSRRNECQESAPRDLPATARIPYPSHMPSHRRARRHSVSSLAAFALLSLVSVAGCSDRDEVTAPTTHAVSGTLLDAGQGTPGVEVSLVTHAT